MKKPTLQEYLRNNPSKGLNDYYNEFGEPENTFQNKSYNNPPPPPPPPVQQQQPQNNYNNPAYNNPVTNDPNALYDWEKKKKTTISFVAIIAALLIIASMFLPWLDLTEVKKLKDLEIINGYGLSASIFSLLQEEDSMIYKTIFAIPIGAIIALIGEFTRNWMIRSLGQVVVVAFGLYWIYLLYSSYNITVEEYKLEAFEMTQYFQYGVYMVLGGILLFFIEIGRTMFGRL